MFEFIKKWCKKEEKGEKNSMFKVYETELAGRKLTIETGKFAGLANGSVTVRYRTKRWNRLFPTISRLRRKIIFSWKNTRFIPKKRRKTK